MLDKETLESSEFDHQAVSTMPALNNAKSVAQNKLKPEKGKPCKKCVSGKRKAKSSG